MLSKHQKTLEMKTYPLINEQKRDPVDKPERGEEIIIIGDN